MTEDPRIEVVARALVVDSCCEECEPDWESWRGTAEAVIRALDDAEEVELGKWEKARAEGGAREAAEPAPSQLHVPPIQEPCTTCGHIAFVHDEDGCEGEQYEGSGVPCQCPVFSWLGLEWKRPGLPAPEGLTDG